MRIRMLVQMPPGALRNGQPWPGKGKTDDIPTGEASHLVAAGVAEEIPVRRGGAKREQEAG